MDGLRIGQNQLVGFIRDSAVGQNRVIRFDTKFRESDKKIGAEQFPDFNLPENWYRIGAEFRFYVLRIYRIGAGFGFLFFLNMSVRS